MQFFSQKRFIEIIPSPIFALNQIYLPSAWPLLHCLLTLNGKLNVTKTFVPHDSFHIIFLREAFGFTFAMLVDAGNEITSYANIKCAIPFARKHINGIDFHFIMGEAMHVKIFAQFLTAVGNNRKK
jgi:hypothetical protein